MAIPFAHIDFHCNCYKYHYITELLHLMIGIGKPKGFPLLIFLYIKISGDFLHHHLHSPLTPINATISLHYRI